MPWTLEYWSFLSRDSEAYHFQKKLSETISMKMHEKVIQKGATN